ncbi:MAG: hypothetical protein GXN96_03225 [Aquificae bacterium]|nr:hypothetical protein [Aquificota bacterium]
MSPEEVVLTLKGQFFLSPRERFLIQLLREELGYPEEVIAKGIEECLRGVPPDRRRKYPLFRCLGKIRELYEKKRREEALVHGVDWRKAFSEKLRAIEVFLPVSGVATPGSEEEAEKTLRELESRLMKKLWEELPREKKKEILKKYGTVREEDEELFRELVREELRKLFSVPSLSIYAP